MSAKVVLFFKAASGYGWSETYYTTATGSTLTSALSSLITNRMALSGSDTSCIRARIATGTKRIVQVLAAGGGSGVPGSQAPPTSAQEVALVMLLSGTVPTAQYNRKFLKGIPERVISENTFVPDSSYNTAMNTFLAFLTSGLWSVQGRINTAGPKFAIVSLTPTPPRGVSANVAPTFPAVLNGSTVRITGVAIPGYNGLKVVESQTAGPAPLLQLGGAAPPAIPPLAQGFINTENLNDVAVNASAITAVSRRASGGPFGRSRGRRATLYSLRR